MKQFTIPTKQLQQLLSAVAKLNTNNTKLYILENVKLDIEHTSITATKSNLKYEYSATLEGRFSDISFSMLLTPSIVEVISKSKSQSCTVSHDAENQKATIAFDTQVVNFACDNVDNFPSSIYRTNYEKKSFKMALKAKDLFKLQPCVSKDELRPAMQYFLFDFFQLHYNIVATNAHILGYVRRDHVKSKAENFMLPAEALKFLFLKKSPKNIFEGMLQVDTFSVHAGHYQDKSGKWLDKFDQYHTLSYCYDGLLCEVIYKQYDGEFPFPDYRQVVPDSKEDTLHATLDRAELIKQTKTVLPMANRATNQVLYHFNGQCDLSAKDVDFGYETKASLPSTNMFFKGDIEFDISFNGKFLIDILNLFEETKVEMHMSRETRAMTISEPNIFGLIMPLMRN